MILRTAAVVAAAVLVASAAPAKESPSARRECFHLSEVTGYTHARNNRVYVHTGPRDIYLFQTMGSCPDLDWSEAIALDAKTSAPICAGIDVDLIVPSNIGPHRCPVSMIRKLARGEKEQK